MAKFRPLAAIGGTAKITLQEVAKDDPKVQGEVEMEEEHENIQEEIQDKPAPLPTKSPATTPVQQKAQTAAKEKVFDEESTYVGVVSHIVDKGNLKIFKLEVPGYPTAQAYSNALSKATLAKMQKGSKVQFTPNLNEGGTNGSFFTAVDITVLAQDPAQSILAAMVDTFKGAGRLVPEKEVSSLIVPDKSVDENIAAIEGALKGDILGYVEGRFFLWQKGG
jgi:hypothetical protein